MRRRFTASVRSFPPGTSTRGSLRVAYNNAKRRFGRGFAGLEPYTWEQMLTAEQIARLRWLGSIALLALVLPLCAQEPSPQSLYNDAGKALDSGNTQLAIKLYQELLEKAPDSVEARTNLGVALAEEGRYGEAVAQYHEALKRSPQNQIALLNLAIALYKQAQFDKAREQLETLHKLNPSRQQAFYLLVDCDLRLGKFKDAIALVEPAYNLHPEDPALQYALGTALIEDGQTQQGAVVIDNILKNGNSPIAATLIGASQYNTGDYKSAAQSLRKALDANPSLPGAWTLYGRALVSSGDNAGAKAAFQRALENDPNDFDACLHLGGMLRHDGDIDAAAPYIRRALTLRPDSPAAKFQAGALDIAMGHLEQAKAELEELSKQWPDFVEAHVQLAVLYARMNRPRDSQRERQIVLALNAKARSKGPQPAMEP